MADAKAMLEGGRGPRARRHRRGVAERGRRSLPDQARVDRRDGRGRGRLLHRRPRRAAGHAAPSAPTASAPGTRSRCAGGQRPLARRIRRGRGRALPLHGVAWVDHFLTWRTEFARREDPADIVIAARVGAQLAEEAARARQGRATARSCAAQARLLGSPRTTSRALQGGRAGRSVRRSRCAIPIAACRRTGRWRCRWWSTASARASPPGTSCSRARPRAEPGPPRHARATARRACPTWPSSASTCCTCRRSTRSGAIRRKGPQQRAGRRAGRCRQPVGDRLRRGRPQGGPPGARHARRLPPPGRARRRARHRDRARHRLPVRAGPPLRQGASRVVPLAPGRHGPVRGEPAQEVPGHLPVRLRERGLARAVGGTARACSTFWIGEGVTHLPRRQSAHEGLPVLGVGDRRGQARAPGGDLPRRGVHAAQGDAPAGQARLHAVLHLLHLAQHARGAHRVLRPSSRRGRGASTSGPTSGRTRRTSSPRSCSSAAGRRSCRGSCWRRRCARTTASTARPSSSARRQPRDAAARSTSTPRSTSCATGTWSAPTACGRSSRCVNRIRRENPALQSDWSLRFFRPTTISSCATAKSTPDGENVIVVVVNLDPHHVHSGWIDLDLDSARPRGRRFVPDARPAHRRALPLARLAQLRAARSAAGPGAHLPRAPPRAPRAGLRLLPLRARARSGHAREREERSDAARAAGPAPRTTPSGTRTRSSTSCTSRPSSTRTTTASATSAG